jgi:hypothetical protein
MGAREKSGTGANGLMFSGRLLARRIIRGIRAAHYKCRAQAALINEALVAASSSIFYGEHSRSSVRCIEE